MGNPHCPAQPTGPKVGVLKSFSLQTPIFILFCLPMCLVLVKSFFLWASAPPPPFLCLSSGRQYGLFFEGVGSAPASVV